MVNCALAMAQTVTVCQAERPTQVLLWLLLSVPKYPTVSSGGIVTNNNAIYTTSLQNDHLTWERTTGL
jgi:hypothetical protein